jgi:hypothetical protein
MNPLAGLQVIVDSGLFVLIWLVQLVLYPSFRFIEKDNFRLWHNRYCALMGLVAAPLMLIQVAIEALMLEQEIRWPRILGIGVIWVVTFSLSESCHQRLHHDGRNMAAILWLIRTNWIRTIICTLLFWQTGAEVLRQDLFFQ